MSVKHFQEIIIEILWSPFLLSPWLRLYCMQFRFWYCDRDLWSFVSKCKTDTEIFYFKWTGLKPWDRHWYPPCLSLNIKPLRLMYLVFYKGKVSDNSHWSPHVTWRFCNGSISIIWKFMKIKAAFVILNLFLVLWIYWVNFLFVSIQLWNFYF